MRRARERSYQSHDHHFLRRSEQTASQSPQLVRLLLPKYDACATRCLTTFSREHDIQLQVLYNTLAGCLFYRCRHIVAGPCSTCNTIGAMISCGGHRLYRSPSRRDP